MPEELSKIIETDLGLPVGLGTKRVYAVTGEQYVTLTSGGIKPEGREYPAFAMSPEKAWQMYRLEAGLYFTKVTGGLDGYTLYWRTEPELVKYRFYTENAWEEGQVEERVAYVYWSRLLISNQEPRQDYVVETAEDRAA